MQLHKLALNLFQMTIGQFMFFAAFDSIEYAKQVGSSATPLDPTDAHGRVRIGHFEFTDLTAAAADTLNLLKMPAGKVRVLKLHLVTSAFEATADLDIGYSAYTNRSDRAAVNADADAFANDLDVATGGTFDTAPDVIIDSTGGWTLTGTLATAGASGDTIKGWVEYVID